MANKRIIAYFMHEHEQAAAQAAMPVADSTDSYVVGDIDETAIEGLKAQGLIVQELDGVAKPALADLSEALRTAHAAAHTNVISADAEIASGPGTTTALAIATTHTIRILGPLLVPWRAQLEARGVRIIEAIGPQLYSADLAPDAAPAVRSLPFVASVEVQTEQDKTPAIPTLTAPPPVATDLDRILFYDIRLKSPADTTVVRDFLDVRNVLVAGSQGRKIRVALKEDSPLLGEIAALPEVYQILEFVPPKLSNNRARILLGIDKQASPVETVFPFDGTGQIIGIADTGIDDQHPDFQGRFAGIVALGRANDHSDPDGHGTHVAGSVGGNGSASGGEVKGVAPGARIFFQSVMDAKGELGGLPLDNNTLFDEAYQAGARIHNNSWGSDTASRYTFSSIEADEFVDAHRDMTIVIAAGNEGTARKPFHSKPGFVDWLSIGSPATAKNAVTVGASQTDRTQGGYSQLSWGQSWPNDFPAIPIANEKTSGDPESMAAFSSRGPCDDRRIKPDVVAPGTNIASTKSSRAPLANFWGPYPGHSGHYAYMGGTSMAAPIVTGCLALIRQYYVDKEHVEPSAALMKATLVNGTRALTGPSSTADFAVLPNFHQGFGCVHMPWTVPSAAEPSLKLAFLDTWKDPALQFAVPGQRLRYRISVGNARELRLCLAYTDVPARALQNNLNLLVQFNNGQKWVGNQDLPMRLFPVDADNNVEIVRIPAPQAGDYLIQIFAQNLLGAKEQDFALVVTGDLKSGLNFVSH